jgi:hypothetical protein
MPMYDSRGVRLSSPCRESPESTARAGEAYPASPSRRRPNPAKAMRPAPISQSMEGSGTEPLPEVHQATKRPRIAGLSC